MPDSHPVSNLESFDWDAIDEAFKQGNLAAVKDALRHPTGFPRSNTPGLGDPLSYAVCNSPVSFVRQLLELGADPNCHSDDGFPPLITAVSCKRPERTEITRLLLEFGADVCQCGINNWLALHWAAYYNDAETIQALLQYGADPNARTNVDHYETALEQAVRLGHAKAVEVLCGAVMKR